MSSDLTVKNFSATREYTRWFIFLRWAACAVAGLLVILSTTIFHYLEDNNLAPLLICVLLLAASNLWYALCLRKEWLLSKLILIQILTDLFFLTALLHFSGGIENPLAFAYVFHVVISGMILDRRFCFGVVILGTFFFIALALGEMTGLLEHYTLQAFPHVEHEGGVHHAALDPVYTFNRIGLHFILLLLTAFFTTSIINRLRSAERNAETERQRLESVTQATGVGLIVIDQDFNLKCLNQNAEVWKPFRNRSGGATASSLKTWLKPVNSSIRATFDDAQIRFQEMKFQTERDGNIHYALILAPLTDETGNVYQVALSLQDITERKLLEAEMIHAGKMAIVGQMASGIAHEVGNPLASISTRLTLMEDCPDEVRLKESIGLLKTQIARIGRIVHGVSQFSRPTSGAWEIVDINALISETLEIFKLHKSAKTCQFEVNLQPDLPGTSGIGDQLVQVFLNLGINAIEAMPKKGKLSIRTFASSDNIHIEFADTGEGISEEQIDRIFEPFYTTKKTGLGIGLSLVYQIINAHGGMIEAKSNAADGTTFTIILPILDKQPSKNAKIREG